MSQIFLVGAPTSNIKSWIIDHYYVPAADPDTHFTVQTTSSYKKSGIYSAQRDDASQPVVIDWGDGTIEEVNGNVSQKFHTYASVGIFEATISNVKTFAASANNFTWYNTISQNRYTLKEVAIGSSATSIGNSAFSDCSGLTSVMIPDSVASIGANAFYGCSGLMSVTFEEKTLSQIQSMTNYSNWFNDAGLNGDVTIIGSDSSAVVHQEINHPGDPSPWMP